MNKPDTHRTFELTDPERRTTQAAEGLMRRAFTVAEVERMVAAGILAEDERVELIGGELVPMSAKGIHHEVLKVALAAHWYRVLPDGLMLAPETTFRLDDQTYLEPDFVFYRRADGLRGLKPETCLLAVEVADTSLAFDRGRKARVYAMHHVRELWVIDAVKLETTRFRRPGLDGYLEVTTVASDTPLTVDFAAELAVRLADLDLT
ncbi:MAG: Uma2 family endonuclease [Hyphomicrobiaceae bacterium]|nr:Uma2 family endonuclease [Hyphomicrobiaceae bacterium]